MVVCFLCKRVNSLPGAASTPLRTIAGRCTREHLAVIQMGTRVVISKKVSPRDQISGELLLPQT
jgi:hypothetical protein